MISHCKKLPNFNILAWFLSEKWAQFIRIFANGAKIPAVNSEV